MDMPKVLPGPSCCGAPSLSCLTDPEPSISGRRDASATLAKMWAAGALMTRSTLTTVSPMLRPPIGPDPRATTLGRPAPSEGVGDQVAQLHPLERGRVRRRQDDRRPHARLDRLLPARRAQAPLVA